MASNSIAPLLTEFGFTALESEIYVFLLGESPATGYRIGQAINKPAANVYKAIQSLEAKGAVATENEGIRSIRPVPAAELIKRFERDFKKRLSAAEKSLTKFKEAPADDAVLTLKSEPACLGYAMRLILAAKKSVVIICDPAHLEELEEAIAQAEANGVRIQTLERPGGILRVGADHRSALTSGHDASGYTGYLCHHPIFGASLHDGIACEIAVAQIQAEIEQSGGGKRFTRIISDLS